jgi:glycosyltransferase involved in cell wall biosynthesis
MISNRPLPGTESQWSSVSPKLIVSGHFVRTRRVGGAEQMLYNLLRGLGERDVDTTVLCGSEGNLSETFMRQVDKMATVRVLERGGTGTRFVAEQRACFGNDLSGDAVLFPNYYVPPMVPRRLGRIGVVMHDFQYRHYPRYFSAKKRAWLRLSQALAIRHADRVIAISEFVRQDAIRLFGDRIAQKVSVVPNALCWERFDAGMGQPRPVARPYILSVAAHYPHKNLETLVRAFAVVAQSNSDIQLILCGQSYDGLHGVGGTRGGVGPLIQQLGLADRIELTGFIDDQALARWYEHAELFAFPSLFEGFGMPPVEALGFGLPTLTTSTTAMPEVTMGMAGMVDDPLDADEWADKIMMILRNRKCYSPAQANVAKLRSHYAPSRIADAYVAALTGRD